MKAIRSRSLALAVSLGLAAPAAFAAPGDVFLFNQSNVGIAPYFKLNCLNTGWLNFGGVGPQSFFGWGPLAPDGCSIEFTYTIFGAPPPQDPVKGNHRTRYIQDSGTGQFLVVGADAGTHEMEGPDENGR
jgi:hypothetical protein